MLQTFICRAEGILLTKTNETVNMRWMTLNECKEVLTHDIGSFYPMHINVLKKYMAITYSNKHNMKL